MKKFFVLALVLSLLAMTAVPAVARGGRGGGGGRRGGGGGGGGVKAKLTLLEGTISAIDAPAQTVTITVVCGNKQTRQYVGQSLTISTSSGTQFLQQGSGTISFSDLAVDQKVRAEASLANDTWTAKRITSGVEFKCSPNGGGGNGSVKTKPVVLEGTLTAVDAEALTVTLAVVCGNKPGKAYIGQSLTISTTSATQLLQQGGGTISFADLAVDQKVRVDAGLSDSTWTATSITSGVTLSCVTSGGGSAYPYPAP